MDLPEYVGTLRHDKGDPTRWPFEFDCITAIDHCFTPFWKVQKSIRTVIETRTIGSTSLLSEDDLPASILAFIRTSLIIATCDVHFPLTSFAL